MAFAQPCFQHFPAATRNVAAKTFPIFPIDHLYIRDICKPTTGLQKLKTRSIMTLSYVKFFQAKEVIKKS